jgi:hypothetical protein
MSERCIEIIRQGNKVSARVTDEKGNKLKPTEEEKETIAKEIVDMLFSKGGAWCE